MAKLSAALAAATAVIAVGQWLVLLPLFAMGAVNEGRVYDILLVLAFFGWPAAAVLAALAAGTAQRQPRRAAVLLLPSIPALLFPFFIAALVPIAGVALALASARAKPSRPGP